MYIFDIEKTQTDVTLKDYKVRSSFFSNCDIHTYIQIQNVNSFTINENLDMRNMSLDNIVAKLFQVCKKIIM